MLGSQTKAKPKAKHYTGSSVSSVIARASPHTSAATPCITISDSDSDVEIVEASDQRDQYDHSKKQNSAGASKAGPFDVDAESINEVVVTPGNESSSKDQVRAFVPRRAIAGSSKTLGVAKRRVLRDRSRIAKYCDSNSNKFVVFEIQTRVNRAAKVKVLESEEPMEEPVEEPVEEPTLAPRIRRRFHTVANDFNATYDKTTYGRLDRMVRQFTGRSTVTAVAIENNKNAVESVTVTESQYSTLLDERWLSETVVNAYSIICETKLKDRTDFVILPSGRWTSWNLVVKRGNIRPRAGDQLAKEISQFDKVIVPIIDQNHWTLVVIANGAFYCYNSMASRAEQDVYPIQQVLTHGTNGARFADWPTLPQKCGKQNNGSDCGVFVAQWIRSIAQGMRYFDKIVAKNMQDFRRHMVEELFQFATPECLEQYRRHN
jgi:hypothetical protein